MNNKPDLRASLARMEALENRLKELGVPVDALPDVMSHIDEYAMLKDGLDKARETQFAEDAYDFLASINQASNKNVVALSAWLRQFATHVAKAILNLADPHATNDITVLVDGIPALSIQETDDDE